MIRESLDILEEKKYLLEYTEEDIKKFINLYFSNINDLSSAKKRFFELSKKYHPDTAKNPAEKNFKEHNFKKINAAYSYIKNNPGTLKPNNKTNTEPTNTVNVQSSFAKSWDENQKNNNAFKRWFNSPKSRRIKMNFGHFGIRPNPFSDIWKDLTEEERKIVVAEMPLAVRKSLNSYEIEEMKKYIPKNTQKNSFDFY